jgi:hypothetical protein
MVASPNILRRPPGAGPDEGGGGTSSASTAALDLLVRLVAQLH